MLEKIDLNVSMDKQTYKTQRNAYVSQIAALQRKAKSLNIPILIIFEGWDASGKGTLINQLTVPMDPRNLVVYSSRRQLSDDEIKRHFLWRYWTRIPEKGQIVILDEGYYGEVIADETISGGGRRHQFQEINEFEKMLSDSGVVIVKFFIHVSKKEQKSRFKKLLKNPSTAWRVTPKDLLQNANYKTIKKEIDHGLELTDSECAHWHIIEGSDKRFATIKIMDILTAELSHKIDEIQNTAAPEGKSLISAEDDPYRTSVLSGVDMSPSLSRQEYQAELKHYQKRLRLLEYELYRRRVPVIIGFEGWDAGGKGGAIKRLCQNLDPRGYIVHPTAAPTKTDLAHHWLWRFWKNIPKQGHIAIFDRTWYGRVMVEPIEGFCTAEEYNRAFNEINTFERQMSEYGAVIVKFWMNITKDEQESRFNARMEDPDKQWKITDEDWRNREKWDQYEVAVDRMLLKTSTEHAPWIVVEGNDKYYARVKVIKSVVEAIEKKFKTLGENNNNSVLHE